jgi:hypothetical protein
MNEWISFEERWPREDWPMTVKFGDREEIAKRYGNRVTFMDQDKMRVNPPKEEVTHWKAGRWLK